ncbi:hypothetical protein BB561_006889, partial [Smittium simulii]
DTEAGTSCNWMGLELVYPELKTHINYVFKIRNGTYWTARRYAKSVFIEECPFCRNIAPETIEHMLLECSRWQALRADILAQYINIYRAQVATKPPILPASISMRLVDKLLGEELKFSSTRITRIKLYSKLKLRCAIKGEVLCGRANQLSQLKSALRQANAADVRCNPGYLGLDCVVENRDVGIRLSCNLRGKPGKDQGAQQQKAPPPPPPPSQQELAPPAPALAPGGLRAVCPLIVDIQKCMKKCVDDALA